MPTSPIDYPLINGHRVSYASIEAGAFGVVRGIKSIDYDDGLKPGKLYGTGVLPIGRTRGQYEAKASIELYRAEWENFKSQLGQGFMEIPFPWVVQFSEPPITGAVQPVQTDTLEGCRIMSVSSSNAEGTDASTVKLELDVMRILWNGVASVTALV